ncbi:MAG: hypothetical protein HY928_01195 [Elusimicrobia bacterium]|nr:hypothetical protein [Elusimicrobiota bacterium]
MKLDLLEQSFLTLPGTPKDPDWEALLTPDQRRQLERARFRFGTASIAAIEKNLVAFGILSVDSDGNASYPEIQMQGWEFKGQRLPWTVAFRQPKEGEVTYHGKVLRGQEFRDFIDEHDGMTSPDGTTLVWGPGFWENPLRLPEVLYHELIHYQLFADKTWAEREEEAYKRTKDIAANLGLPPKEQKAVEERIEGIAVKYGIAVSLEKNQHERERTWLDRLSDRLKEWRGLPPVKENPGYSMAAGYSLKPDALKEIREEARRLRKGVRTENAERAAEFRREEGERRSRRASEKADDAAYAAIDAWARRACALWDGAVDAPMAGEWYRLRDQHVPHTGPSDGRVDARSVSPQPTCADYLRESIIHEPGRLDDDHRMRMDAWWAADRLREGRRRAAAGPGRAIAAPAEGQTARPTPPPTPPPQRRPPPPGDDSDLVGPKPPVSEPCLGGGHRCGPVRR